MTLDNVIITLKRLNQDIIFKNGFGRAHASTTGWGELAFEPAKDVKVLDMLKEAEWALGKKFASLTSDNVNYTMTPSTECHIAKYGKRPEGNNKTSMSLMFIDELIGMINPKYV